MDKVKYEITNERGRNVTLSFGIGSETLSSDPVVRWLTPDQAAKLDNTAGIAAKKVEDLPAKEKAVKAEPEASADTEPAEPKETVTVTSDREPRKKQKDR